MFQFLKNVFKKLFRLAVSGDQVGKQKTRPEVMSHFKDSLKENYELGKLLAED